MIAPGLADALERWLAELSSVGGRADNTREAYRTDVAGFLAFLQTHHGGQVGARALADLTVRDMRAWMAHERGRGLGARSLARALSAVKSFVRWVADAEGFDPTAVLMVRSPKFQKKLPRPLAEDAARAMIETVEYQSREDWIARRDMAVLTLLYGCGLRISEALGLFLDHFLGDQCDTIVCDVKPLLVRLMIFADDQMFGNMDAAINHHVGEIGMATNNHVGQHHRAVEGGIGLGVNPGKKKRFTDFCP